MIHLKKFNESVSSKRLSVEDIEDYFLDFIDNGSMEFYHIRIPHIGMLMPNVGPTIETTFVISNKFRNIDTVNELTNFTNLISQIGNVVKRWNLDFKFSTIAIGDKPGGGGTHQTQLSIIQPLPKIIIDNFYRTNDINDWDIVNLDGLEVSCAKYLNVDNNSDFILRINIESYKGGSGQNGPWLKPDYTKFRNLESDFIKHFTDNKELPCEFIRKEERTGYHGVPDKRYGQPFYSSFFFKLLV